MMMVSLCDTHQATRFRMKDVRHILHVVLHVNMADFREKKSCKQKKEVETARFYSFDQCDVKQLVVFHFRV